MTDRIDETIARMTRASMPGMLLTGVNITEADPTDPQIVLALLANDQYLWCYRQGHTTIYGTFFKAMKVQRIGQGQGQGAWTFAATGNSNEQQQQQHFAIKWVSIQKYREDGEDQEEDPYNEIRIKTHICRFLRLDEVTNNGIILPVGVVSNETQEHIDPDEKYFFILAQLANGGDLYEAVMEENDDENLVLDSNAIRHLFRQMVKSIQCLHENRVFHRDLSVENFVLNNNGGGYDQSRIYVIDFGQARIVDAADRDFFQHDNSYFGKPAYTPPELIHGHDTLHWKKVDVWALGVTLYYMFLRQPPLWSVSNTGLVRTNVTHALFDLVCRQGRLADWLRSNGVGNDIIPDEAVEVMQGMLMEHPGDRLSTVDILNSAWLASRIIE